MPTHRALGDTAQPCDLDKTDAAKKMPLDELSEIGVAGFELRKRLVDREQLHERAFRLVDVLIELYAHQLMAVFRRCTVACDVLQHVTHRLREDVVEVC